MRPPRCRLDNVTDEVIASHDDGGIRSLRQYFHQQCLARPLLDGAHHQHHLTLTGDDPALLEVRAPRHGFGDDVHRHQAVERDVAAAQHPPNHIAGCADGNRVLVAAALTRRQAGDAAQDVPQHVKKGEQPLHVASLSEIGP